MSNVKVYKASAGTGKTFNLVKEYLKIALQEPYPFEKILCITFTNKAAEEMKSRIIEDLHNISMDSPAAKNIREAIEKEIKIDRISERATLLLNKILHNYSNFSVSTIDEFFINILKSFTKELKLKPGFELELNHDKVLREIIPQTFNGIHENDFLTEMLMEFVNNKVESGNSWNFDRRLLELANLIFLDEFYKTIRHTNNKNEIRNFYKENIKNFINKFEKRISTLAKDAHTDLVTRGLSVDDFKGQSKTSLMKYLSDLSKDGGDVEVDNVKKLKQYSENVESWVSIKVKPNLAMIEAFNGKTGENIKELLEYYNQNISKYNTSKILLTDFNLYVILDYIIETLIEYRDVNNIVLISDVYRLLKPLTEMNDAPFIYEISGNRYKYFLIDEAQDTSELQWLNLMPLLKNSIAEDGQVVIVGDVKQSIYKFRDAFPDQFIHIGDKFKDVTNVTLKESRRSLREIVDFNNTLFEAIRVHAQNQPQHEKPELEKIPDAYDNHEFKNTKDNEGGYVKIKFFGKSTSSDNLNQSNNALHDELLYDIRRIFDVGYKPNNILILVEKNSQCAELASFLSENNFKVISPSSSLITTSESVRFIVALMRFLKDRNDTIALFQVLQFICKCEDKDINVLLKKQSLKDIAHDYLYSRLKPNIGYLSNLPVFELTEHLLRFYNESIKFDNYAIKFLDTVFKFSVDDEKNLESFIEWWDENSNKISIAHDSDSDSIEIMTIHSSKGLEREIVMIPYTNWKLGFNNDNYVWLEVDSDEEQFTGFGKFPIKPVKKVEGSLFKNSYNKEIASQYLDRVNLTYVSFTRPEHALFIYGNYDKNFFDKNGGLSQPEEIKNAIDLIRILLTEKNKYKLDKNFQCESSELKNYQVNTEDSSPRKNIKAENLNKANWQSKLKIKTLYSTATDVKSDKRLYGNLIHELLSMINDKGDVENALTSFLNAGKISNDNFEYLREYLEEIFLIPGIEKVFPKGAQVINEKEIITPTGKILRPDRVLKLNDEISVIDFKTGSEHESHFKQLTDYANHIAQIFGTDVNTKIILYTSLKKVEVLN